MAAAAETEPEPEPSARMRWFHVTALRKGERKREGGGEGAGAAGCCRSRRMEDGCHLLPLDMPAEHSSASPLPSALDPELEAASFDKNRGVLRPRSDRPDFLARGARLGARALADDNVEEAECECDGVAMMPRAAASLQWKEEDEVAWLLEDRSRMVPECFAPPLAREGENSLTFAKASVIFSLSPSAKLIVTL